MKRIALLVWCVTLLGAFSGQPALADRATAENAALAVLEDFLGNLSVGEFETAYSLVALSAKQNGADTAYKAPLDFAGFKQELSPFIVKKNVPLPGGQQGTVTELPKFKNYKFGAKRWQGPGQYRIFVHFAQLPSGLIDNDEVLLIHENGRWYIADPIHIVR